MQVTIDGRALDVAPATTVLEAIRRLGGDVPTLCYDERQAAFGACRVCLVGLEGAKGPVPACTTPCAEGMVIDTRDATARRVVGAVVELVLSELPEAPGEHTELAAVARELGIGDDHDGILILPADAGQPGDVTHGGFSLNQLTPSCRVPQLACRFGVESGLSIASGRVLPSQFERLVWDENFFSILSYNFAAH